MMAGSMRQRGRGTWELRVYLGLDPETDFALVKIDSAAGLPTYVILRPTK